MFGIYCRNALPRNPVRVSTNSTLIPDSSVSSLRPQTPVLDFGEAIRPNTEGIYPTDMVRPGCNTPPSTPVRFGTNSIPVPDTSASSVHPPKMPWVLVYVTDHPLQCCIARLLRSLGLMRRWEKSRREVVASCISLLEERVPSLRLSGDRILSPSSAGLQLPEGRACQRVG